MTHSTTRKTKKRRGFTLPEILVSITLVAVLAAVVVPTIASQVKRGDPARIGQDFVAVRGAVEQFLTDVRKYPSAFTQLQSQITTAATPLSGTSVGTFGVADVNRWRGPYLNRDLTSTGAGATVATTFGNDQYASNAVSPCFTASCGVRYMVLTIPINAGGDSTMAVELDRNFDDGDTYNGNIRYKRCLSAASPACSPNTAPDTIKLLILPIH